MSTNFVSNQEVIPTVETRAFEGHETARLAVGIVAVGTEVVPGMEEEFKAYLLLRGNVYAKQKNYMPVDELNPDGTESDADDAKSIHFVVIENAIENKRVVGSMRLIIKQREDQQLPIEEHYPAAFEAAPAPVGSTEASRLIARHENPKMQNGIKWVIFAAATDQIMKRDLRPVYGAVEEVTADGFERDGMSFTKLGEPEFVPEFNATKLPIKIDIVDLNDKLNFFKPELMVAMPDLDKGFVYDGTLRTATPAPAA